MTSKVIPEEYKKVAIVGGTGELGKYITREFLSHKEVEVTLISRKSSDKGELKNEFKNKGAKVIEVDYDNSEELTNALSDVSVVISTISGNSLYETQKKILDASVKAQIKLFIPSEFGSEVEGVDNPFFIPKAKFQKDLFSSNLNYIIYNNGFFIEHILLPLFCVDIKKGTASIIGTGDAELTVTSMVDIAKFVYHTYYLPEVINQKVDIVGENTTLNKIVKDVSEATGKSIKTEYIDYQKATDVINNKSTDFMTLISYIFRRDIEQGIVKLNSNSNHLIPDFKFTSIKDYALKNLK